ncbi:heme-binding protein [Mesorhizobium sp.]|uniref:heme-binding protein n=1 Tax=Mesorhizobium sp. TaxID=1871066 RepID=UPI003426EE92
MARASEMGVRRCFVVVDASGETIASLRMDGARYLNMHTARAKARTAASINAATGAMSFEAGVAAAVASRGGVTSLPSGLPIRFDSRLAGLALDREAASRTSTSRAPPWQRSAPICCEGVRSGSAALQKAI